MDRSFTPVNAGAEGLANLWAWALLALMILVHKLRFWRKWCKCGNLFPLKFLCQSPSRTGYIYILVHVIQNWYDHLLKICESYGVVFVTQTDKQTDRARNFAFLLIGMPLLQSKISYSWTFLVEHIWKGPPCPKSHLKILCGKMREWAIALDLVISERISHQTLWRFAQISVAECVWSKRKYRPHLLFLQYFFSLWVCTKGSTHFRGKKCIIIAVRHKF